MSNIKDNLVFAKDGYYKIVKSPAWGKFLIPSENPDGIELTDAEREGIQLNKEFPKIPADKWQRYLNLCFYLCPRSGSRPLSSKYHDEQLEVQVCLLRDAETLTKWKLVVPKQVVSGVSVKATLANSIDIETGERYTQFPPPGWVHAGSSHSHNTMPAFFSSTDDKSELSVPGLHIVVGDLNHDKRTYTWAASIVQRKMRKDIEDLDLVVDGDLEEDLAFHPDVTDYIEDVREANKKLYARILESKKPKQQKKSYTNWYLDVQSGKDWRDDIFDGVFDFDDASIFRLLDQNNSDLIDDAIASMVEDWLDEGVDPAKIRASVNYALENPPRSKHNDFTF